MSESKITARIGARASQSRTDEVLIQAEGSGVAYCAAMPPNLAAEVKRRINTHEALMAACEAAGEELAAWESAISTLPIPAGMEPRTKLVLHQLAAALAAARAKGE